MDTNTDTMTSAIVRISPTTFDDSIQVHYLVNPCCYNCVDLHTIEEQPEDRSNGHGREPTYDICLLYRSEIMDPFTDNDCEDFCTEPRPTVRMITDEIPF